MKAHKAVDNFKLSWWARDMACGLAAGLCAGACASLIYLLKPREFDLLTHIKFMLVAVSSYSLVALIFHKIWAGRLRRMLPNWIPISVFGSVVFIVIALLPAFIRGWTGPTVRAASLSAYIAAEAAVARNVIVLLSALTLPLTGLIYYSDSILTALRRWHSGTAAPSILKTQPPVD